jgi:molybdate transport system substrate-binding protein
MSTLRWARHVTVATAALVMLATAACGPLVGAVDEPTVLAAASLTGVLPAINAAARFSFAGSDTLAFQIQQGAPADVFAAASPKYPQQLFAQGLVAQPRPFAINSLVLIVPRANPARITGLRDLSRDGVRIVLGDQGVPVGDYARQALAALGLSGVLRNVVSLEPNVKGVAAKVALGEADAGFVYATDVRPVRRKVRALRLPAAAQPDVEYQVAVLARAPHPAAARAFVRRLLSPTGRRILVDHGFRVPAG